MADAFNHWSQPEFWEQRFRQMDTPWDLDGPHPSLVELGAKIRIPARATVFVPGCGRGHDALHFAKRHFQVSAVDWSPCAAEELRVRARKEEIPIEILNGSVWEIPDAWKRTFDLWVEHTFFCAIDPADRPRYVNLAAQTLKPGGQLIGLFFIKEDQPAGTPIRPENMGPPFSSTRKELETLFKTDFDVRILEPTPFPHPNRGPFEWWVHLIKK